MKNIKNTLVILGFNKCYAGFKAAEYCIRLAVEDESRLSAVIKEIYMEVAPALGKGYTWCAVERNIRTAISRVWKNDPEFLNALAGRTLPNKPTVSEFIAIVSDYVVSSEQSKQA